MLESNYSTQVSDLLSRLQCHVRIPSEWDDYFSAEGLLRSIEDDRRRKARKQFRTEAVLQIEPQLPSVKREQLVHKVYTRDISLEGISFLHCEQLYPGEVCRLWLADRRLAVEVVRCKRANSQCYVVGGTYHGKSDSQA